MIGFTRRVRVFAYAKPSDIFGDIEVFYNRARDHSDLGGVSPEAFEAASNHRL